LEAAVAVQVDAAVSGDNGMLALSLFEGIPVLSPSPPFECLTRRGAHGCRSAPRTGLFLHRTNATRLQLSWSYASREGLEARIETAHTPGHRVPLVEKAWCQVGEGRGIGDSV